MYSQLTPWASNRTTGGYCSVWFCTAGCTRVHTVAIDGCYRRLLRVVAIGGCYGQCITPFWHDRLHEGPRPVVRRRARACVEAFLHAVRDSERGAVLVHHHVRPLPAPQLGRTAPCPRHPARVAILLRVGPARAIVIAKCEPFFIPTGDERTATVETPFQQQRPKLDSPAKQCDPGVLRSGAGGGGEEGKGEGEGGS